MANYAVLELLQVAAQNIDSYNVVFESSAVVENGQLFSQGALSATAGETEVYATATPATATLSNLFMAYSPEDVILAAANGNQYKVGDYDPRNFANVVGLTFTGYRIALGDKIKLTAEGFTGTKGASDVFAVATDGQDKLVWGTAAGNGVSYALDKVSYVSIPSSTFGSQRVVSYQLRCVNV
jgi:hypothetical protein